SAEPPATGSPSHWCARRRSRRSAPPRRAWRRRSRMSARPWPRLCADSAGRRNCRSAPCRPSSILGVERGDDRFAVLAVVLGLLFVAADDIANAFGLHLLDEQLRLSRLALDQEGHERIVVLEDELAHDGVGALARAEDVVQLALLEPSDG